MVVSGSAKNVTISGGKGNDEITLSSSTKNNVIQYARGDGEDVIYGFNSKYDILTVTGGSVDAVNTNGSDGILKIGDEYITIVGASESVINVNGSKISLSGALPIGISLNSAKTAAVITSSLTGDVVDFSSYADAQSVTSISVASSFNRAIEIIGNAKNNVITAGKGGATLNGDGGNDTLIGGNGKDIFVYSSGADVIQKYSTTDSISLEGGIAIDDYASRTIKGDVYFYTDDGGSIQIKDGEYIDKITVIDSNGKSKVYSANSSSGSNGYWFTDDDNFISDAAQLDEISSEDYSVTNLENMATSTSIAQLSIAPYSSEN